MKKVIVTGATGFLGKKLVNDLLKNSVEVYAIVRDIAKANKFDNSENLHIVQCNMNQYYKLDQLINEEKLDTFYHFAWEGTAGCKRENYSIQLNNVKCSCDALYAAKRMKVKKFIFAGSIIEYEAEKSIEKDISKVNMSSIYGLAKRNAKNMIKVISKNIGMNCSILNISNIFGVGEKSERLINYIINNLMNNKKVRLSPCKQLYDFIYIDDAIEAIKLVGEKGRDLEEYYIGNPKPKKLLDFVNEIGEICNKKELLVIGAIEFNGISLTYKEFNTESLFKEFNFTTKVTFKEGIKKTIEWYKKGMIE